MVSEMLLNKRVSHILAIIVIIMQISSFNIVKCTQEFQVYRMQQFDLQGSNYGSRSTAINYEARTINSESVSRKCVLIRLNDLTIEKFRYFISQTVSSIIVTLPNKYDEKSRENLRYLENTLLKEEIKIPVYFALETEELNNYYGYIENEKTNQFESAFQALTESIATNGFQFVVNSQSSQVVQDFQTVNLQARLFGINNENKLAKTIIITAHYDSFGMATSLSYGCDSNGSGVVALLELSRLLSYLYSDTKTSSQYNIIFLLTSGGKFNHFGTKKWIEEQLESNEFFGKIDIEDIAFTICLDSLANNNTLNMHVSKPPKENQASFDFLKKLEKISQKYGVNFEMIHKKINLANEIIAWEHERFSLNKISAFTLSHHSSHKDISRLTMTDTRDSVDDKSLSNNIKVIAEALGHYIYNNISDDVELFTNEMSISSDFIKSWLDYVCSVPRSLPLLNKNNQFINVLYSHFTTYLKDPLKYIVKTSPKEPEFVLYNEEQSTLVIYNVKPAIFDLFLALIIFMYLFVVYLFIIKFSSIFHYISSNIQKLVNSKSTTKNKVA